MWLPSNRDYLIEATKANAEQNNKHLDIGKPTRVSEKERKVTLCGKGTHCDRNWHWITASKQKSIPADKYTSIFFETETKRNEAVPSFCHLSERIYLFISVNVSYVQAQKILLIIVNLASLNFDSFFKKKILLLYYQHCLCPIFYHLRNAQQFQRTNGDSDNKTRAEKVFFLCFSFSIQQTSFNTSRYCVCVCLALILSLFAVVVNWRKNSHFWKLTKYTSREIER